MSEVKFGESQTESPMDFWQNEPRQRMGGKSSVTTFDESRKRKVPL